MARRTTRKTPGRPARRRTRQRRPLTPGARAALLVVGTLLALAALGATVSYRRFATANVLDEGSSRQVHIPRGTSFWGTYRQLVRDGHVRADPMFPVWLAIHRPRCLQAGLHQLPEQATPTQLFELLCTPTQGDRRRLTVPEGRNVFQIADLLDQQGVSSRSRFLDAATSPVHIELWDLHAPTAEGFLFPDTWYVPPDASAHQLRDMMIERFVQVFRELNEASPRGLTTLRERWGVGLYEAIIIASIVEKEAVVDSERPVIARVILNRLERGMRIQCDPTCVYGPDRYTQVPTREACRDPDNRYSTYVIPALPPTPIANPGRRSLHAVLNPADDPDVLYFAAMRDGTGRHAFAATLDEHNRNVRRYLQRR